MSSTVSPPEEGRPAGKSARRARRGPRLRAATFADHLQIDRLGARYGLKAKSYEEWSHLWLDNPVYRDVRDRWDIGWVLEDERGGIVGSVGNIPVSYELDGRTLLAASSHAWVAEPEYRGAALVLLDHLIDQAGVDLFVSTTVSALSTPGVAAYGCTRVPVGVWDESAFWITHYRGFLESYLTLKQHRYARPLSYPLSVAVHLKDLITRRARSAGGVEVQRCSAFDERFDGFWEESKRNTGVLLAGRTREVLNWHYAPLLASGRLWIAGVADGGRLVAYAVFDRSDKPAIGLKRVRLLDYQSLDGSAELLWPLLSWALERCRAEGVHVLEHFGRWLEPGEALDGLVPYRRKLPTWISVYRANEPSLAERLEDRRVWAPTLYDGDASLVR